MYISARSFSHQNLLDRHLPTTPGDLPQDGWVELAHMPHLPFAYPYSQWCWSQWRQSGPGNWPCSAWDAPGRATSSSASGWGHGSHAPSSGAHGGCDPGSPALGSCENTSLWWQSPSDVTKHVTHCYSLSCGMPQQQAMCITEMDLLKQFLIPPPRDRCCRSNLPSHSITEMQAHRRIPARFSPLSIEGLKVLQQPNKAGSDAWAIVPTEFLSFPPNTDFGENQYALRKNSKRTI